LVPKHHGSATLIKTSCFTQLEEGADSVGGELQEPVPPISINNNNNNTSSNKNTSSQELSRPSLKVTTSIATGVVVTGSKFAPGVIDTGGAP
jgi:hypothetical protein